MDHSARVYQAPEDRRGIGKVLFTEPERQAEAFGQIGMSALFFELVGKVVVESVVMGVLHHAQGKALQQDNVVQVVLQRPPLESPHRELPFPQLGEVATRHQLLDSGLDDLGGDRVDEGFVCHGNSLTSNPSGVSTETRSDQRTRPVAARVLRLTMVLAPS